MNNIASLPFLPVPSSTFVDSPFFLHDDVRIVRAGFWLMEAAFRSSTPGSISADVKTLMSITRLTLDELNANYEALTKGWTEVDGNLLYHNTLGPIAEGLDERFGPELAIFAESAALACQGGSGQFELLPASDVKKKRTGKHLLPANFTPDKDTLAAAINEGYTTPETQKWLMTQLSNYADAGRILSPNWNAFLRKYLGSSITRKEFYAKFGYNLGHPPLRQAIPMPVFQRASPGIQQPQRVVAQPVPVTSVRPTFTQMAANNTRSIMEASMNRFTSEADPIVSSPKQ